MSAPLCMRCVTQSTLPCWAAMCSGVNPFCKTIHVLILVDKITITVFIIDWYIHTFQFKYQGSNFIFVMELGHVGRRRRYSVIHLSTVNSPIGVSAISLYLFYIGIIESLVTFLNFLCRFGEDCFLSLSSDFVLFKNLGCCWSLKVLWSCMINL